jgi:hypothetical protein
MRMPGFGAVDSIGNASMQYKTSVLLHGEEAIVPQAAAQGSIFGDLWCKGGCLWDWLWCRVGGGPASFCDFHAAYCLWACGNPTSGPVIF